MTYRAEMFDDAGDFLGYTDSIPFACEECGTDWDTLTAADECALLDVVEARQIRAAEKKRKPWDSGIIRSVN